MAPVLPKFECVELEYHEPGVLVIAFNRPSRSNAFNPQMYSDWRDALVFARDCEDALVTIITGRGRFYSSGQELSIPEIDESTVKEGENPLEAEYDRRSAVVLDIVHILIDFPKLIFACVNGPAFGFSVSTMALCDSVYASQTARFQTPFMKLGFCVEGVSSVTFPRILGNSRANEMLLMGRAFSAAEMERFGFVSQLFKPEELLPKVLEIAKEAAKLPRQAIVDSKKMIRDVDRKLLHEVGDAEFVLLKKRMFSDESAEAIMNFLMERENKRSKL
ncbi:ClpP/crotonase [Ramicandelaber brevisporus]|nr:ClpP/crotonase [Ramicandelaber brevisporus]